MTPNLDFKVTMFFNARYFENGTRYSTVSCTIYCTVTDWSIEYQNGAIFNYREWPSNPDLKGALNVSETTQDKHTVTTYQDQQ